MNQLMLFIGLKLAEITGIIFIPLYLGKLLKLTAKKFWSAKCCKEWEGVPDWIAGLMVVGVALIVTLLLIASWELSGEILK